MPSEIEILPGVFIPACPEPSYYGPFILCACGKFYLKKTNYRAHWYQEHWGRTPHWWSVCIKALDRGGFTNKDIRQSSDWGSCPCGFAPGLARDKKYNIPVDDDIAELGVQFWERVEAQRPTRAICHLLSIEAKTQPNESE